MIPRSYETSVSENIKKCMSPDIQFNTDLIVNENNRSDIAQDDSWTEFKRLGG